MKKSELKSLLKPMIKECIKEVIFEEGVLSNIVSEVATGLGRPTLVESKEVSPQPQAEGQKAFREHQQALVEHKKQLLSSINADAYGGVDLFEGTAPLSNAGSVSSGPQPQGPLSDMDPSDPGVDISSIVGMSGNRWAAHMK